MMARGLPLVAPIGMFGSIKGVSMNEELTQEEAVPEMAEDSTPQAQLREFLAATSPRQLGSALVVSALSVVGAVTVLVLAGKAVRGTVRRVRR